MRQINNRFSLNVGIRLFLAGLILWMGILSGFRMESMVLAAFVAKFPGFRYVKGILGDTLTEEETKKQTALLDKIKDENKKQLDTFRQELSVLASQAKNGMIDETTFKGKVTEIMTKLEKFDGDKFEAYQKKLDTLETAMMVQGTELKKLKDGGLDDDERKESLHSAIKGMLKSEDWKAFVDSGGKKKVEFTLKAVSLTNDYSGGTALLTTRSTKVIDHPTPVRLNIRDMLTVAPTDLPYLAFLEVYDWVRNIKLHTENERLAESTFKVREATTDVKRIGTHIVISKRMLRSLPFLQAHLESRIPALVRYFEDFYLLFGDGVGLNPLGIFEVADNFATVINTALTGIAGTVASVATYDTGTKSLITFAANQSINNGDTITFAGGAGGQTVYNAAFAAKVIGPRAIVIDLAYVAGATAAWTWTVNSRFKNKIFKAQEIDVLKVAKALVTRQEYAASAFVMHPDDAVIIETLKGNDEHYLDVQRSPSGVLTISGIPVIETTAMPSGKFAVGDFSMAAALFEFTPLKLEFSESTEEKLTNTVVAIIQEEILFPIYNKYMFLTGDFTTAKAAILLP